jgi:hypothetical protein
MKGAAMSHPFTALAVVAVAGVLAAPATADAPPVGPLPPGPVSTIQTRPGQLVAIALPHRSGGIVWRSARNVDAKVLREVEEADVGSTVVVVFKAFARGSVRVVFAATRGETAKALEARTFRVVVR